MFSKIKFHYFVIAVPFVTVMGSVQSGESAGSSRTFNVADPMIYLVFVLAVQRSLFVGRKVIDRVAILFIAMIVMLGLSAVYQDTYFRSDFLFPFKNFTTYLFLYIITFTSINDVKKLEQLFYALVGVGVVMCIQARAGFMSVDISDIAYDRGLAFAGGLTWNMLVGTLSYLFPFIFILMSRNLKNQKKLLVFFLSCVIVVFVFIIVLSGGRQALGTVLFSGAFYILLVKGRVSFGKKLFALIAVGLVFYASLWVVSTYFPEFAGFAAEKRSHLESDFINQRVINFFWYPLQDFNLGEYLIFGDGYTNKHNVVTTVLYRFGVIGSSLFWARFIAYRSKFSKLYILKKEHFLDHFAFPLNHFVLILFVNFFMTNFVANIWHQVPVYGYFMWMSFGGLMGAVTHTYVSTNDGVKKYKIPQITRVSVRGHGASPRQW